MNTTTNTTKRSVIETTVTMDNGGSLTLDFANGKQLVMRVGDLAAEIAAAATLHGLKQKLVDAAAISRDPSNGRAATVDTKYEAVKEVFDRLMSGAWNKVREGAGAGGGLLFRALCRMYEGKKTAEEIREYLEGKTDAEKAALRKNPRVAAVIDELRAEAGKDSGVDTDGLLGELED